MKYRRVYSYHFHTTIAESIHTAPNSIQCPLKNANWDDVFGDENPYSAYDTFLSIMTSLINKCLPLKKVKRKITDKSEWLTKGIIIY